jgi:hypothetical protein
MVIVAGRLPAAEPDELLVVFDELPHAASSAPSPTAATTPVRLFACGIRHISWYLGAAL